VPQLLKSENYIYFVSRAGAFSFSGIREGFFMVNMINGIKINVLKNKGLIIVILLVLSLLIPSIFTPSYIGAAKKNDVLKVVSKSQSQTLIPTITVIPTPTISIPSLTPVPTSAVSSPTPTVTPTPTSIPATTPTSTPTSQVVDTQTPTPTSTPSATFTETPTPTPAGLGVQVGIDYAGQKASDLYSTTVSQGQSAWDAVVSAVGSGNLQYTDYGGDMGIFITGFNGINAASNQYFEFRVNGVSSMVGVSSYKCNNGDKLGFVLTSF
jgi:hypothetical protein